MTRLPIIVAAAVFTFLLGGPVYAQQINSGIDIQSLHGGTYASFDSKNNIGRGTNGVLIIFNG